MGEGGVHMNTVFAIGFFIQHNAILKFASLCIVPFFSSFNVNAQKRGAPFSGCYFNTNITLQLYITSICPI